MKHVSRLCLLLLVILFSIVAAACKTTTSFYRTPSEQATAMLQDGIASNEKLNRLQAQQRIPNQIKSALIPGAGSIQSTPQNLKVSNIYEKRFNIAVSNVPADLFFKNLSKEVPYSIIVNPKIIGSITINLKNASIIDLLNALRDAYGFDYHETSFGFEVLPAKLQTRSFHVNYLDVLRNTNSNTQISANELSAASSNSQNPSSLANVSGTNVTSAPSSASGQSSNSQVNTSSTINFWSDLALSLQALVGSTEGRSVMVNPESGTVIVKGYPEDIKQVTNFLDQIQSNMSREVVLEVKLLEVQLNDAYSAGVNWDVFGFQQSDATGGAGGPDSSVIDSLLPTGVSPLTTITVHGHNFSSAISLLEQQGNVQTIANPRVLSINNQQAVIRIGTDQFFVTGITDNISNNGATNTVTSASVSLTPFFSGVILDITPQISKDGEILLHLHPVISDVEEQNQTIDIGASTNMKLPLAINNVREYDSIVRAKNQQVVVVGGLTQNTLGEHMNNTPLLSKIPFFGMLFRSIYQSSAKTELVILLKPTIIGQGSDAMANQLPVAEARIGELNRGFHQGSLTELFGNEAEDPIYDREAAH